MNHIYAVGVYCTEYNYTTFSGFRKGVWGKLWGAEKNFFLKVGIRVGTESNLGLSVGFLCRGAGAKPLHPPDRPAVSGAALSALTRAVAQEGL